MPTHYELLQQAKTLIGLAYGEGWPDEAPHLTLHDWRKAAEEWREMLESAPPVGSYLLAKHHAVLQGQGKIGEVALCRGCASPTGTLAISWPCDVVKALAE